MEREAWHAWIIDGDHRPNPGGMRVFETGAVGPKRAPADVVARLEQDSAVGLQFRMTDHEGLVYSGRIVFRSEDRETWDWFAPLDEFGRGNAGCTGIAYLNNLGAWEEV